MYLSTNFREIAEEIIKNNFNISLDKYTKTERFKIKEEVYKALRFDHVKEFALETLKDSYSELVNNYSEEEIDELAEYVAEEWVYNDGTNSDLTDYENICKLIDDNYSNILEPNTQEK